MRVFFADKRAWYRFIFFFTGIAFLMAMSAVKAAESAGLPDFTVIVEQSSPAVVNISTTQKAKPKKHRAPSDQMPDVPEGTPFDEFFRRFFGEDGGAPPEEYDGRSLGSGFIISADGYVLTNNHVISDADEIIVRLSDKRELAAELVGTDKRSDVALLKIKAQNLPVLKMGKSGELKAGEWVLAIGSPFDFDHSVTAGIVSAVGRSLPNENYVPFIQTDVAINPGNSGGPLFNLKGEVVGINSQIYSRTGGFMGLSFAIPIDLAMDVVDQIKNKGHVSRGWLGVLIQDVTRELAESFGMAKPEGALVARVLPGSPAEHAGLKVGDVIVEFAGKHVADSASLPPIVGSTAIDAAVNIKIIREGKSKSVRLKVGELPENEEEIQLASEGKEGKIEHTLGVVVSDLTEEQRKELEAKKSGILVEDVKNGPARRAGVRRGDIILMLNNVEVESVKQFQGMVNDLPEGKSVPLLVNRRGGPVFLALKITKEDKQ